MNGTCFNSAGNYFGSYFPNWRFTDVLEPHVPITGAATTGEEVLFQAREMIASTTCGV